MTKENIIDLYNILKECMDKNPELEFNDDMLEAFPKLTYEDIQFIKNSPWPWHVFKLLTDEYFKGDFSQEVEAMIIYIVNNSSPKTVEATLEAILAIDSPPWDNLTEKNIIDILTSISNAKGSYQAMQAAKCFDHKVGLWEMNNDMIPRVIKAIASCRTPDMSSFIYDYLETTPAEIIYLDSFVTIIEKLSHARTSNQTDLGRLVAEKYRQYLVPIRDKEKREKENEKVAEMVSMVTSEKNSDKADDLYYILRNNSLFQKGITLEVAKLVKKSICVPTIYQMPVTKVALNNNVLENFSNEEILELIGIVSKSKTEFQAVYSAAIATDENIISIAPKLIFELTKIVRDAKNQYQSMNALIVAQKKLILEELSEEAILKLAATVANTETDYQSDYATSIALNPLFLGALYLVSRASKVPTNGKVSISLDELEGYIINAKKHNYPIDDELSKVYELLDIKDDFWSLFKRDPETAITLLTESAYEKDDEIEEDTKITVIGESSYELDDATGKHSKTRTRKPNA